MGLILSAVAIYLLLSAIVGLADAQVIAEREDRDAPRR